MNASEFAGVIAEALRREYGNTGSAMKTIATLTGAHERAVRNWFESKNGPGGVHLIALMRNSEAVLTEVLRLAGREHVNRDQTIAFMCTTVRKSLAQIEQYLRESQGSR